MKTLVLALSTLLAGSVMADDFDARHKRANDFEATPAGRAYTALLFNRNGQAIADIMRQCVPEKGKLESREFVLLGDVTGDQCLHNIVVRPRNKVTRCVEREISKLTFPAPEYDRTEGIPFVFEVQITK